MFPMDIIFATNQIYKSRKRQEVFATKTPGHKGVRCFLGNSGNKKCILKM